MIEPKVGETVFFRGPHSRKPYRVEIIEIVKTLTYRDLGLYESYSPEDFQKRLRGESYSWQPTDTDPSVGGIFTRKLRGEHPDLLPGVKLNDVAAINVKVGFTNGTEDIVSNRFLYHSWDEAIGNKPIRSPKIPEASVGNY